MIDSDFYLCQKPLACTITSTEKKTGKSIIAALTIHYLANSNLFTTSPPSPIDLNLKFSYHF